MNKVMLRLERLFARREAFQVIHDLAEGSVKKCNSDIIALISEIVDFDTIKKLPTYFEVVGESASDAYLISPESLDDVEAVVIKDKYTPNIYCLADNQTRQMPQEDKIFFRRYRERDLDLQERILLYIADNPELIEKYKKEDI